MRARGRASKGGFSGVSRLHPDIGQGCRCFGKIQVLGVWCVPWVCPASSLFGPGKLSFQLLARSHFHIFSERLGTRSREEWKTLSSCRLYVSPVLGLPAEVEDGSFVVAGPQKRLWSRPFFT
jgi:hypothetical protein